MHAVKKSNAPNAPTVSDLEYSRAAAEHNLMLAQRANSAALGARALIRSQGDAEAIAENRREIAESADAVRDLTDELEAATAALAKAKEIERSGLNDIRYATIRKALSTLVKSATACEDSGSAKSLVKVREDRQAVADELSRAGVAAGEVQHLFTDSMILRICDLQAWLDSNGSIGRPAGLLSAMELRQSGRASLRIQANEFRGVVLRVARLALGVSEINEGN
jgi:hypothetical protein